MLWLVGARLGISISPAGWPVPPQGKPLRRILEPPGEPQPVVKLEVLRADEVDRLFHWLRLSQLLAEIFPMISVEWTLLPTTYGSQTTGMGA
jgi:hypothetical protein